MNNRIGYALTAALLITIVVTAVGFSYLQNEINDLKPQAPSSVPTTSPPTNSPSVLSATSPTSPNSRGPAQSSVPYSSIVF